MVWVKGIVVKKKLLQEIPIPKDTDSKSASVRKCENGKVRRRDSVRMYNGETKARDCDNVKMRECERARV